MYIIAIFSPCIPCNNCCLLPSSSTHLKMYGVINFGANKSHWKYISVWLCACVCVLVLRVPLASLYVLFEGCIRSFWIEYLISLHKTLDFLLHDSNLRLLIGSFVIQVICLHGPRRDSKCQSVHSKLENHYLLLLLDVLASHNKASLVLGVSKLFSKDNVKNGFKRATQRDNMIIWFPW